MPMRGSGLPFLLSSRAGMAGAHQTADGSSEGSLHIGPAQSAMLTETLHRVADLSPRLIRGYFMAKWQSTSVRQPRLPGRKASVCRRLGVVISELTNRGFRFENR